MIAVDPSNLATTELHVRVASLARWLWLWLLAALLAMIFVPWQQSVRGSGRVIAYAPVERQQAIEAPVEGRVVEWHVQEGDRVSKGDAVVTLSDNDPEILARLEREYEATRSQVEATKLSIAVTESRISSLDSARLAAVSNAKLRAQMARDRKDAAAQGVIAAKATLTTAELNLKRQRSLHEEGLASTRDRELAELDRDRAEAELDQAQATLAAAEREISALQAELERIAANQEAELNGARASLQSLYAGKAKIEAEQTKVEVRLARQRSMRIDAPRAGTILRLVARPGGEIVKASDPLALLVPERSASAVELWVDGNDAPLVQTQRPVRLQFEGWPALQFVGWPAVAVGTFGGRVAFVDAAGDGTGRFRVVVVPDHGHAWPEGNYLRQGVRANGWVLLDQVRLGFEIWRQLNGFPPSITLEQNEDPRFADKESKVKSRGANDTSGPALEP